MFIVRKARLRFQEGWDVSQSPLQTVQAAHKFICHSSCFISKDERHSLSVDEMCNCWGNYESHTKMKTMCGQERDAIQDRRQRADDGVGQPKFHFRWGGGASPTMSIPTAPQPEFCSGGGGAHHLKLAAESNPDPPPRVGGDGGSCTSFCLVW